MSASRVIEVRSCAHDDWIVREGGGRELGHYPSAEVAEAVGRKLARKRRAELLIYAVNGKLRARSRPGTGWFGRLFGR